jgi:NADPH:quinone reductase-like Zn-dependent oxidoreductase
MRAVVYRRYGPPDVLTLEEIENPLPSEDEVLIKVARLRSIHTTGTLSEVNPILFA